MTCRRHAASFLMPCNASSELAEARRSYAAWLTGVESYSRYLFCVPRRLARMTARPRPRLTFAIRGRPGWVFRSAYRSLPGGDIFGRYMMSDTLRAIAFAKPFAGAYDRHEVCVSLCLSHVYRALLKVSFVLTPPRIAPIRFDADARLGASLGLLAI